MRVAEILSDALSMSVAVGLLVSQLVGWSEQLVMAEGIDDASSSNFFHLSFFHFIFLFFAFCSRRRSSLLVSFHLVAISSSTGGRTNDRNMVVYSA